MKRLLTLPILFICLISYGQNKTSSPYALDSGTGAITTIEYEHHEIHEGNHFYVCGYDLDFDDDDTIDFQLTTPNTNEWIHMSFHVASSATITLNVYEDATVVADGAAVTAYNNNRNNSNTTSLTLLQVGGEVTERGTLIYSEAFGSGSNPSSKQGGISDRERELLLKQNSTYRFEFECHVDNVVFDYCGEWYEHTNK